MLIVHISSSTYVSLLIPFISCFKSACMILFQNNYIVSSGNTLFEKVELSNQLSKPNFSFGRRIHRLVGGFIQHHATSTASRSLPSSMAVLDQ